MPPPSIKGRVDAIFRKNIHSCLVQRAQLERVLRYQSITEKHAVKVRIQTGQQIMLSLG
jgi:hypothetical protein